MSNTETPFRTWLRGFFAPIRSFRQKTLGLWREAEVIHLLKVEQDLKKSLMTGQVFQNSDFIQFEDPVLRQPWDFELLKLYSKYHAFLSMVHGAILRNVAKRKVIPLPNFVVKCMSCGREYQTPVEQCINEDCQSTDLREPEYDEFIRMDSFLKLPNRQNFTKEIVKSLLRDGLATANAYLNVSELLPNNYEVFVEPVENIWIAATSDGLLGNEKYFCQECWEIGGDVYEYDTAKRLGMRCPKCGGALVETYYVFRGKDGKITARYTKDEIIHFNFNPMLPSLYGFPLPVACLMHLRTVSALDKFNYENYTLAQLSKIIILKGTPQTEVNDITRSIMRQEDMVTEARRSGQRTRLQRALLLGDRKGADVVDAMPSPKDMMSLEWYSYWLVNVISPVYGIQPVYINAATGSGGGGGGYFQRMEIVVNDDTILDYRGVLEEGFKTIAKLMRVNDWHFGFQPLQPKDHREEAQKYREQLAAMEMAARLGMTAKLEDDGDLKISGEVDMEIYREFAMSGGIHAERVDNLPESDTEPRQDGDENLLPGDNTPR